MTTILMIFIKCWFLFLLQLIIFVMFRLLKHKNQNDWYPSWLWKLPSPIGWFYQFNGYVLIPFPLLSREMKYFFCFELMCSLYPTHSIERNISWPVSIVNPMAVVISRCVLFLCGIGSLHHSYSITLLLSHCNIAKSIIIRIFCMHMVFTYMYVEFPLGTSC